MRNVEDKENQQKRFNFETWMFVGAIIILSGILLFSLISFFAVKSNDFWQNYWTGIPIFISLAIALGSFYVQMRTDKNKRNFEKYLEFQEYIEREMFPKIANFIGDKKLDDRQLTNDLLQLLIAFDSLESKRKNLLTLNQREKEPEVAEYLEPLRKKLATIINDEKYAHIVEIVSKSLFPLSNVISDLNKFYADEQMKGVDDVSLSIINDSDNKILGWWVISEYYAKRAKYLVGVATKDRRVVGVYKLDGNNVVQSSEDRKYFKVDVSNRLFLENDNNRQTRPFPRLDDWRAKNPVLYYLGYVNWLSNDSENEDRKYVMEMLNISTMEEFRSLSARDVIVVRTYKFDQD